MAATALDLTSTALDPTRCPRIKPDGEQCRNMAGHRTDHRGFGWCWKHAGNTSAGKAHGAKLAALAALPATGGEVDVNPLDALLYTVRRASGLTAFHRMQAEAAAMAGEDPSLYLNLERQAANDLARWAKMAIDAGVAERMVRIAEGTGERIAGAFEEGIAAIVAMGVELTADNRRAAVVAFSAALSRLEREQPSIPAKASDM